MPKQQSLLSFFVILAGVTTAQTISPHLKIDQFGYLPEAVKIAVIADPQQGFNANESYAPGNTFQLRRAGDGQVVFSGSLTGWNNGATDAVSGDKAWWFDFSTVSAPGEYYVYDPANNTRSETFQIAGGVYEEVMKTAFRTFFYQRCGVTKPSSFAGSKWADESACHIGANQDKQCRLYGNATPATERDLSGGWHDAGDYNKYVNFALNPVLDLARCYLERPEVFGDDMGLPESGNGVPDLLDELKWELDWLLKMQEPDGSVLCVVGGGSASPPSADVAARRYGPATTSATFSAAAMFAIGSRVFRQSGNADYADQLQTAATSAWAWAAGHPGLTFYNAGKLAAGEQETDDYGLFISRLCAAVYLYDITGEMVYRNWVENNYNQHHLMQWSWASMYEVPSLDALLHFTDLPGVSSPVATAIRNTYSNSLSTASDHLGSFNTKADPYRAYLHANNYVWGSNQIKSKEATAMLNMLTYNLNATQHTTFHQAAAGYLHYLHGTNPFNLCFLSNMKEFGAENSAREMYHTWFGDGTPWDNALSSPKGPAPGFLTGGPNRYFSVDGCCPNNCGSAQNNALCAIATLEPPLNQPAMKSYKDWNTSWPQNSWQITEPAIYYQTAYLRLLSWFIQKTPVGVENTLENAPEFTIAPNPAAQVCRVQLSRALPGDYQLVLTSSSGRIIRQMAMTGTSLVLDLNGLPSGMYFVEIRGVGQGTRAKRLVVR